MATARPSSTSRSGNPPGGVSPVCPGPGTNGDVLLVAAAGVVLALVDAELDDELLDDELLDDELLDDELLDDELLDVSVFPGQP
jgi:hypothetical protein